MKTIGDHQHVTLYEVGGWCEGIDRAEERCGATCEECGVWRGPTIEAVEELMATRACRTPEAVLIGLGLPVLHELPPELRDLI